MMRRAQATIEISMRSRPLTRGLSPADPADGDGHSVSLTDTRRHCGAELRRARNLWRSITETVLLHAPDLTVTLQYSSPTGL